jgi:uncharacterized protein YycO
MSDPSPDPRPAPQPGDILLFFHAHRSFDYVIKLMTFSRYYHAGLYAGEGKVIEARPRGVACNEIGSRRGGYIVLPAPDGKGADALAWAKTQIGAGYDRVNMLVMFLEHVLVRLHLNIVPYGKYSCAEFVATAFYHAGLRLFPDQDLNDVEPKDLARLLPPGAKPHNIA